MKKIYFILVYLSVSIISLAQGLNTFHDFDAVTITGDTISLSQYAGKKLMIVNTASYCGYTPQFTDLEQLYTQYNQYNFEILGFPCNDFGNQDPHSDSAIYQFCTSNYNVTFQMMKKIFIVDSVPSPIYDWLQQVALNGVQDAPVTWNFHKFLIDEAGHWVNHYSSQVLPNHPDIINWIMSPTVVGISNGESNNFIELRSANPVSSKLDFKFNMTTTTPVSISIWSTEGKMIDCIHNSRMKQAETLSYNTSQVEPGIYFVKVANENFNQTIKFVVLR